jgi:hypothetical protein
LNCDPNTLSKAASCLFCGLSSHQLNLARIRTLCAWAGVAGGSVVAPGAPTNPDIGSDFIAGGIQFSWTNPTPQGAKNEIWKSTDGVTFNLFSTVGGGVSSFSDNVGIVDGIIWYYKVRSCNGASCSAFTNPVGVSVNFTSPNAASISLPNLIRAIGFFRADGLALLTSVSLPALKSVSANLDLANNPNLTVITLTALATVGGSLFLGSNKITGAFSLPALLSVGADLQFQSNALLTSFSAPVLSGVGGNLVGRSCAALTSVTFTSLTTIGSGLDFTLETLLTLLSFPALTSVGQKLDFNSCNAITSASFPVLNSTGDEIDFNNCPALTLVQLPAITSIIYQNVFQINGQVCPLLTTFNAPSVVFFDGSTITFAGDALNAVSVNQILHRGVVSALTATDFELAGGTNASPSGAGIADKATLILAGNTVNTN